jgi:hypothetical protein
MDDFPGEFSCEVGKTFRPMMTVADNDPLVDFGGLVIKANLPLVIF